MKTVWCFQLVLLLATITPSKTHDPFSDISFPLPSSCPTVCGVVSIIYPFGIGKGCFRPGFELVCNHTYNPPFLYFPNTSIRINNIDTEGKLDINTTMTTIGLDVHSYYTTRSLPSNQYLGISSFEHLQLCGCNAILNLMDVETNASIASCSSLCFDSRPLLFEDLEPQCCAIEIPDSLNMTNAIGIQENTYAATSTLYSYFRDQNSCEGASKCTRGCGGVDVPYPFGIEPGCSRNYRFALICNYTYNPPILTFNDSGLLFDFDDSTSQISNILLEDGQLELKILDDYSRFLGIRLNKPYELPAKFNQIFATFNWIAEFQTDSDGKINQAYRCQCNTGYEGNPYIIDGCKDINECEHLNKYECHGFCTNTNGSYYCTCPSGFHPDPITPGSCFM